MTSIVFVCSYFSSLKTFCLKSIWISGFDFISCMQRELKRFDFFFIIFHCLFAFNFVFRIFFVTLFFLPSYEIQVILSWQLLEHKFFMSEHKKYSLLSMKRMKEKININSSILNTTCKIKKPKKILSLSFRCLWWMNFHYMCVWDNKFFVISHHFNHSSHSLKMTPFLDSHIKVKTTLLESHLLLFLMA